MPALTCASSFLSLVGSVLPLKLLIKVPYILTVENNLELQMEIEKRCDLFWESIKSKTPIGFANSELKLFPVRPSIILSDSKYQEDLLENINTPQKVMGSIVFVNPSPKDVTEMRRLNPNHEVVDLIDY